jgi:hypothetical protein
MGMMHTFRMPGRLNPASFAKRGVAATLRSVRVSSYISAI